LDVHRETSAWPRHERYGLISQARRAAYSIPSNIAEGCGRDTDPEFARFVRYSMGSASELSYFLMLARDIGYFPGAIPPSLNDPLTEVRRMLAVLVRNSSPEKPTRAPRNR